jgi:hypothetical protein
LFNSTSILSAVAALSITWILVMALEGDAVDLCVEPEPRVVLTLFESMEADTSRATLLSCFRNYVLEDSLTIVLELNYPLGNLFGAPAGIRTPNLLIRSQMLYPLSYGRQTC